MAKRRNNTVPVPDKAAAAGRLAKALVKLKKAELVDIIVKLAGADRGVMRRLEAELNVAVPPRELIVATRQAIADATAFDEREINDNFDYDYGAYSAVERNLGQLIEQGYFREAMALSLELMRQGSYQVEMSDEGLMTGDIEECLQVVIGALTTSGLSGRDVTDWCAQMSAADRLGFISDAALQSLREQYPEGD